MRRQIVGCGLGKFVARTMLASIGVISVSACATLEVEAEARQTAECMAAALESTNRAEGVKISRSYHYRGTSAALGYAFRDESGTRHYVWLDLTAYDGMYVYSGFDRSKSSADPVLNVEEIWRMNCHVEATFVVE